MLVGPDKTASFIFLFYFTEIILFDIEFGRKGNADTINKPIVSLIRILASTDELATSIH